MEENLRNCFFANVDRWKIDETQNAAEGALYWLGLGSNSKVGGAQKVVPGCRYISQLTSDKSTILGQERMEVLYQSYVAK